MTLGNACRFVRYTFTGARPRHRHQRSFGQRHGAMLTLVCGGAVVLGMPLWMIILGII